MMNDSCLARRRSMRSMLPAVRVILAAGAVLFCCGLVHAQSSDDARDVAGQGETEGGEASGQPGQPKPGLFFSFDRAPWRDVIEWIALECDLALHFETLPTGSFSYTDPQQFEPQAAIDRLNLFLLPQGYTLVRSGRLLSVINLADPRSQQTLDALARFVPVDELESLESHDVVKCILPLGELEVEDALDELSVLDLMSEPRPLRKTNQLLITDTVGKLLNVKAIIKSFQPTTLDNGTVMQTFSLKHVDAEDILAVARPHLGLATDELIGIDVSLSTDPSGKSIFATGVEDKVELVAGLVRDLDVPRVGLTSEGSEAVLKSHLVGSGDVNMVYDVLQTLLAGNDVRISIDSAASSIVALAPPRIQQNIADTVAQLQASEPEFEIIDLQHADPYFVIGLLEEMLDLPSVYDSRRDEEDEFPTIDADPGNRRLFVRAKPHQIEQIRTIVEGLDRGAARSEDDSKIRVLPIRQGEAVSLLETIARFWKLDNPILLLPSNTGAVETERTIQRSTPVRGRLASTGLPADYGRVDATRLLTRDASAKADVITCQVSDRGLIIQSEDSSALDRLQADLQAIAGSGFAVPSPPIVFYLKYVKPEDALRMLAELLDGGEAALEGQAGTLVNGSVFGSSAYNTSLLTSRDGLITLICGTITVVADPRLNRLIAQGSSDDIEQIEGYLEIIDKDKGLTQVETYGRSHVIEIQYTDASEVASALKEAFAGRVAASTASKAAPGQAGNQERDRGRNEQDGRDQDNQRGENANRSQRRGGAGGPELEPEMTIAVHEPSNSLIVTAPEQLFDQVQQLVEVIDQRSQQTMEVLAPTDTALIQAVLGQSSASNSRPNSSSSDRSRRSSGSERLESYLRTRFGGR